MMFTPEKRVQTPEAEPRPSLRAPHATEVHERTRVSHERNPYTRAELLERGKAVLADQSFRSNLAKALFSPMVYYRRLQPDVSTEEVVVDYLLAIGTRNRVGDATYQTLAKALMNRLNEALEEPEPWIKPDKSEEELSPAKALLKEADEFLAVKAVDGLITSVETQKQLIAYAKSFRELTHERFGGSSLYEIALAFLTLLNFPTNFTRAKYFSPQIEKYLAERIAQAFSEPI
jgi:hypothetical protein